jgi:hypothetical protein
LLESILKRHFKQTVKVVWWENLAQEN